jgi:hypothetical protein
MRIKWRQRHKRCSEEAEWALDSQARKRVTACVKEYWSSMRREGTRGGTETNGGEKDDKYIKMGKRNEDRRRIGIGRRRERRDKYSEQEKEM